jgi:WG repeat protein
VVSPRLALSLVVLLGSSALAGQADTTRATVRLFPIRVNGRTGYIDATGRTIIAPRFQESGPFAEALAPALLDGKWGFIDSTGTFVIAPQFAQAAGFAQGLAPVSADGKWGYIDRSGAWVIRPQFFDAERFSEGLAVVATVCRPDPNADPRWQSAMCYPDKHGYVDRTGRMVIPPRFQRAGDFAQGRAAVNLGNKTGFIDTTGAMVFEVQWARSAPKFADGRAPVLIHGKWGYVDRTGRVVIQPAFAAAMGFSEQLAAVVIDDKWGFIDTSGAIAIAPQFYFAMRFSEGLAAVKTSEQAWGYADRSGRMVIAPRPYGSASGFEGGLAQVQVRDGFRYIDRAGNTVWPESLHAAVAEHPPQPGDTTPLGGTGSLVDRVAAVVDRAEAAEAGKPVDRPEQVGGDVVKAATQLAAYLDRQPTDVRALILSVRLGRFRQVAQPLVIQGGGNVPTFASLAAEYAPHHAALNRALALEPNNAEVHFWKARLFGLSHDWMGMLYGVTPPRSATGAARWSWRPTGSRIARRWRSTSSSASRSRKRRRCCARWPAGITPCRRCWPTGRRSRCRPGRRRSPRRRAAWPGRGWRKGRSATIRSCESACT